jgi:hypothetical protein
MVMKAKRDYSELHLVHGAWLKFTTVWLQSGDNLVQPTDINPGQTDRLVEMGSKEKTLCSAALVILHVAVDMGLT